MEKLISFITSNFYFVILIVGIIYSLFFRKSPLERPRNGMPDFGGGGGQRRAGRPGGEAPAATPIPRAETPEARFPAPQQQTPPPVRRQEQPVRVQSHSAEPRKAAQPSSIVSQETVSRSTVKPQSAPAAMNRLDVAGLTRDDLSRAVVWAEILGPPRARRPHSR